MVKSLKNRITNKIKFHGYKTIIIASSSSSSSNQTINYIFDKLEVNNINYQKDSISWDFDIESEIREISINSILDDNLSKVNNPYLIDFNNIHGGNNIYGRGKLIQEMRNKNLQGIFLTGININKYHDTVDLDFSVDYKQIQTSDLVLYIVGSEIKIIKDRYYTF